MFGKYGIDFGPEAHKGFSDREWKLACEFFDLMLHLPLTEDEDEWDSFFDWALSEVFDVDENTDHEVALSEVTRLPLPVIRPVPTIFTLSMRSPKNIALRKNVCPTSCFVR